jgi:Protein of unknown function (DUF3309)
VGLVLLVVLILLLVGGWPSLGFHQYGYYPSGVLAIILIIVVVMFLMGRF